jgi:hypothetical protein
MNERVNIKRTVANFFITSPLEGYEVEGEKEPAKWTRPLVEKLR